MSDPRHSRRQFLHYAAALGASGLIPARAHAAQPMYFAQMGIAINGFDPVAYFQDAGPLEGSRKFKVMWKGATWRFATAENQARFEASPRAYAPQYGGYCAFAVAHGATASTDPQAWTVHDGKLYLNHTLAVRERWLQDIPGYVQRADANWPDVLY
jgi:YHS domain-containing protein